MAKHGFQFDSGEFLTLTPTEDGLRIRLSWNDEYVGVFNLSDILEALARAVRISPAYKKENFERN